MEHYFEYCDYGNLTLDSILNNTNRPKDPSLEN
jgi:hypothetical protein